MEQINYKSRFAIIFVVTALLIAAYAVPTLRGEEGLKLGQDLKGGTILRFSLDIDGAIEAGYLKEDGLDRAQFVADTIAVIDNRINKFGLSETVLTPVGEDKFEISMPAGGAGGVESIIEVVTALGDLKFRIEVRPDEQYSEEGRLRSGVWNGTAQEFGVWKKLEVERWQNARDTGLRYVRQAESPYYVGLIEGREGNAVTDFLVLEMAANPDHDFDGSILENPRVSKDRVGKPVVVFDVKINFRNAFEEWTGENVKLPMAIVLNEEVTGEGRAPIIQEALSDSVQISLGTLSFRDAETKAKELTTVLQTGSLKIRPTLESKNEIGASIAGAARDRGIMAVIVAFALVLVFMVVYYRAAGMVANVALLLNLVLLVGFLAFFKAALTLPGIAGIVLTVGMAVDANILINERIREERRSGRTVRRALSEGYAKALSAIVDANVTSLITAVFLYWKGSGPVRGFAVTLAIGLVVSMFTAIYVTRAIFEWRLAKGGLEHLGTLGNPEPPKVRWISMRRIFAPLSVIAVVLGLGLFGLADDYTVYDIDFTGGYKLQAAFKEPVSIDEVKTGLIEGGERDVKILILDAENNIGEKIVTATSAPYRGAQVLTVGTGGTNVEVKVQQLFEGVEKGAKETELSRTFEAYVASVFEGRLLPEWDTYGPRPYVHEPGAGDAGLADLDGGLEIGIAFVDRDGIVTADRLSGILKDDFPLYTFQGSKRLRNVPSSVADFERNVVVRTDEDNTGGPVNAFRVWIKSTRTGNPVERDPARLRQSLNEFLGSRDFLTRIAAEAGLTLGDIEGEVSLSKPFPNTDEIHSSVAKRLKDDAIVALFLAMIGIIIYIAIRFKSRAMGFAAVLCLFHDVAITLGIVAVANELGIVDAKINLAMVAAFLTLVGYSVNDTVVIFDRIREERGKRPRITPEIIDLSINMTIARTIRTSITFLLVCVALFAFNIGQRNVLEGFSFVLIIGSVIGTYSTIAIASPLLLYLPWLWARLKGIAPRGKMLGATASNPLTLIFVPFMAVLWLAWAAGFALAALVAGLVMFVPWSLSPDALKESTEIQTAPV